MPSGRHRRASASDPDTAAQGGPGPDTVPIVTPWLAEQAPIGSTAPPPEDVSPALSRRSHWRAILADHVPLAIRGGRLALDRRAALALALIVLAGVLLGCFTWWRSRPVEDSVAARVEAAGQPVEGNDERPAHRGSRRARQHDDPSGATATTTTSTVVVDVEGHVARPGVLTLAAGARVADALRQAGGAVPGVDTSKLNLARLLTDGEQVLVGVAAANSGQAVAGQAAGAAETVVDLNAATVTQLETLPGVGPVLAQHMLDWRGSHGRFTSVEQLREVGGIGPRKLARLRGRVRI